MPITVIQKFHPINLAKIFGETYFTLYFLVNENHVNAKQYRQHIIILYEFMPPN